MAKKIKKTTKPIEKKANSDMTFIETHYPAHKLIYIRRIHHLWDNNYRINYHDKFGRHDIKKSFFVTVPREEVKVPESTGAVSTSAGGETPLPDYLPFE